MDLKPNSYFLLGIALFAFHAYNICALPEKADLSATKANTDTLRLLQVLWRHGDRSPLATFSKDPYQRFWLDMGVGQLSNLGKVQHYNLGKYLRQRYNDFLAETYNATLVNVRSADLDRVLMSALSNLAGIYPPPSEIFPGINWQPIPVHTVPYDTDLLINVWSVCPRYDKMYAEVTNSTKILDFMASISDLIPKMVDYLGGDGKDIGTVWDMFDCLNIERMNNYSLPGWVEDEWERIRQIDVVSMEIIGGTDEMARLRGGPLVKEWIDNAKKKIANETTVQFYVYSGQDGSMSTTQQVMGVYDNIPPNLASALLVELHEVDTEYFIQILYKNDTTKDPHVLVVPNCTPLCPIAKFEELVKDKLPDDISAECQLSG